jgi:uncharacterized repeat protein (TIGR01451 family)
MGAPKGFRSDRLRRVPRIATISVLIVLGLMWIGSAQAVHDNGMFELDGNVVQASATPPPYDWTGLFGAGGTRLVTPDPINGPILADTFVNDTDAVDNSYFAGGTKIDDPVSKLACGGPAANDKTSMDFAYAAVVQVPQNAADNAGDQVLYFGLEKQAAGNGGDNAFGFWLFKDKNVGCDASGTAKFTGAHTDGDLFIDGLFTNGGGTSDVEVFRWNGDDATGSLGSTPVATGSVCGTVQGNPPDDVCGIANGGTIDAGVWRAPATTMAANTFVEAGIDMTTLLGESGGCFTTFLADSQSSQSTSSQPKDYAGGQLSTCVAPIIDTTATPGGSSNLIGVSDQTDVATVSPVGGHPDPTGTITFFLCKPSEVTSGGCESGGTQVGSPVAIDSGSATSDAADGSLTTTVGTYCWRAEYTPDANGSKFYAAGSETNSDSECFTVIPNQPTLTTKLSADSILNTDSVTDTATLANATDDASGEITISVYSGSDANACDGEPVASETATPATDGNGDYTATFDSLAAGSYEFQASIAADAKNKSAVSECGTEPLTVMNQPTLTTKLSADSILNTDSVTDTASLAGATDDASGAITISVYSGNDANACDGEPLDSKTATPATDGNGDYTATFDGLAAGKYEFQASYVGDGKNKSAVSECGTEPLTVQNQPAIVTTQDPASGAVGDTYNDQATLSGGASPTGTITFDLYDNPTCSGEPLHEETVSVDGNGTYETQDGVQLNSANTYYWVATYGGDDNNKSAVSGCDEEPVDVKGAAIHILKKADKTQVNVGESIGFTMTVWNSGDGDAHGVKLSDPLPQNTGLSWTIDAQGTGWGGTCSINPAGTQLTCGGANGVTVPANTTQADSTFTVHITSPTTGATGGDCPETGVVDNTGSVTTGNDGSDNSHDSVCVQAVVDLSITKTGSPATQELNSGSLITWTMVVTNNGPSDDTNVTVSDPMPAGNTYVSSTTTQGTCTGGPTLNCDIGFMAAGATVTITLVTKPSTPGAQTNTAVVMGSRPESNLANNTATATVQTTQVFPPPACVQITKITPGELIVGRKTTVKIHLAQKGGSVKGIKVRIKGAGINIKTKGANSKGNIQRTLKMKKKGILVFTPIVTKDQGGSCGALRRGVRGVFTPPVTG